MPEGSNSRLSSLSIAFCLPVILLSCGGGGGTGDGGGNHPPAISNVRLSTEIAPHDNSTAISAYVDFQDSGGDITEARLIVRDTHGAVVGEDTFAVADAAGRTSGTGTIEIDPSSFAIGIWSLDISFADARGTGSNTLPATVRIVPGFGPATFYPNPLDPLFLGGTVVGDINADGRNDVAMIQIGIDVNYPFIGLVAVYYQSETGIFETGTIIQTNLTAGVGGVAIADVTGDGRPDLVVSGTPWPPEVMGAFNGRIVVYPQQPDGTLGEPVEYPVATNYPITSYSVGALAVADIDGDGRNDVAVIGDGSIQILYGNASGTLDNEVNVAPQTTSFSARGGIRVFDIDSNGRLEIIAQSASQSLAILRQTSPRTFASPEIYNIPITGVLGPAVRSFALGDLDGDGRTDILTVDNGNNLTVLHQTIASTFELQPSFSIPGFLPSHAEIVDIDEDGRPDILVNSGNTVCILYQSADHTFNDRLYYGFPTQGGPAGSWALGDVNSDGKPDLLLTWSTDGLYVQEQH